MKIKFLWVSLASLVLLVGALTIPNGKPAQCSRIPEELAQSPITAGELHRAFSADRKTAGKAYYNKTIVVCGKVGHVVNGVHEVRIAMSTDSGQDDVVCTLNPSQAAAAALLKPGQQICCRGVCTDALIDVHLNQCIIINQ